MTNSLDRQWQELASLLGGYFHQDFVDDHGTPDETIAAYVEVESPETIDAAAGQARALARSGATEEELRTIVDELGLYYVPWRDGWTCRGWLEHVAERLSRPARQPQRSTPSSATDLGDDEAGRIR